MVFAWCSFNRNFRCKSPAFAKPFPVVRHFKNDNSKNSLTKLSIKINRTQKDEH